MIFLGQISRFKAFYDSIKFPRRTGFAVVVAALQAVQRKGRPSNLLKFAWPPASVRPVLGPMARFRPGDPRSF